MKFFSLKITHEQMKKNSSESVAVTTVSQNFVTFLNKILALFYRRNIKRIFKKAIILAYFWSFEPGLIICHFF